MEFTPIAIHSIIVVSTCIDSTRCGQEKLSDTLAVSDSYRHNVLCDYIYWRDDLFKRNWSHVQSIQRA